MQDTWRQVGNEKHPNNTKYKMQETKGIKETRGSSQGHKPVKSWEDEKQDDAEMQTGTGRGRGTGTGET